MKNKQPIYLKPKTNNEGHDHTSVVQPTQANTNEENSQAMKLMIHGLLMIWQKRHPMEVTDMLISYIPPEERKQFIDNNE